MSGNRGRIKTRNELIRKHPEALIDLIDNSPYLLFIKQIEPTLDFIFISEGVKNITGYTDSDHYKNPDVMFKNILPNYLKDYERITQDLNAKKPEIKIFKWKSTQGDIITTKHFMYKIKDSNRKYILGFFKDITDQDSFELLLDSNKKMIKMCSYCSNIFDSTKWIELEEFVNQMLKKNFSHGICEKCSYLLLDETMDDQIEFDLTNPDYMKEKVKHQFTKREKQILVSQYQTIFEEIPIGIVGQWDGQIIIANPSFARLLGYDNPNSIIGLPIEEIIAVDELDRVKQRTLRRQEGAEEPNEYFTKFKTKDDEVIRVYLKTTRIALLPYGKVPLAFVISQDSEF